MKNQNSTKSSILKLTITTSFLSVLFVVLYFVLKKDYLLSVAITFITITYHIFVRFFSAVLVFLIFRKNYNVDSWWFRQKKWEENFYHFLKIKKWKDKMKIFTYNPNDFSIKFHTYDEIIKNMCHAELVHEVSAVLCFTSLFFALPFGAFIVFLVTSIFSFFFDMIFVIMQRYNRPRFLKIFRKMQKS